MAQCKYDIHRHPLISAYFTMYLVQPNNWGVAVGAVRNPWLCNWRPQKTSFIIFCQLHSCYECISASSHFRSRKNSFNRVGGKTQNRRIWFQKDRHMKYKLVFKFPQNCRKINEIKIPVLSIQQHTDAYSHTFNSKAVSQTLVSQIFTISLFFNREMFHKVSSTGNSLA